MRASAICLTQLQEPSRCLVNVSRRKPFHLNGIPPADGYRFEMRSERWSMERRSATFHRAAAAKARRLRAEATTLWLKEHLENAIAQHEQKRPRSRGPTGSTVRASKSRMQYRATSCGARAASIRSNPIPPRWLSDTVVLRYISRSSKNSSCASFLADMPVPAPQGVKHASAPG